MCVRFGRPGVDRAQVALIGTSTITNAPLDRRTLLRAGLTTGVTLADRTRANTASRWVAGRSVGIGSSKIRKESTPT